MIWGCVVVVSIYFALIGAGVVWSLEPGRIARRLRVWFWERRIEREANRRLRQVEKARRAADWALASDYRRADRRETRAAIELSIVAFIVIGLVVALIAAGCNGVYPLEPTPDAGADTGPPPLPDCADAYPTLVLIAHGCDDPLHPACESCLAEDSAGNFVTTVAQCHPFGRVTDVCAAHCTECP